MDFHKIAVTGSNSFSGSHFVNYVLNNTDAQVIGISRSPEPPSIFLPYKYRKEQSARFQFHQQDINQDLENIIALLDKEKPEVVVNFASQGEVRNSWKWPEHWYQTNIVSLAKFTNQLKDRDYLQRFVQISTPEVYGATSLGLVENRVYNPSTPYALSKATLDQHLHLLEKKSNFPAVFTRAANVYGPHQQLFRIIPTAIIKLKKGEKIELHGGGKSERAFIHIHDVADATLRVAQNGKIGEIYHISPENQIISIANLVRKICDITGNNFENSVIIGKDVPNQDLVYSLSSQKIRSELAWEPEITLEEGITQTSRWVEDNWDQIRDLPTDYIHKE